MANEEQAGDAPEKPDAADVGCPGHFPIPRIQVVRRMFHEFMDQGYSLLRIAEGLKADGVAPTR